MCFVVCVCWGIVGVFEFVSLCFFEGGEVGYLMSFCVFVFFRRGRFVKVCEFVSLCFFEEVDLVKVVGFGVCVFLELADEG